MATRHRKERVFSGEKGPIEGVEGPDPSVKWKKGLARTHTAGPPFSSEARHKHSAGGKSDAQGHFSLGGEEACDVVIISFDEATEG